MDNFLKAFLPILDGVYLSVAKQKGPRKKDVWMLLDEFNNFVQSIVDINEYPIRDNPYVFNQSIRLQVNEIYTDKHVNMLLPEFLEALCRTVDKASPIPPGEPKEEWPMEKRQAQPLVKKLENILPVLIKLITHPDLDLRKQQRGKTKREKTMIKKSNENTIETKEKKEDEEIKKIEEENIDNEENVNNEDDNENNDNIKNEENDLKDENNNIEGMETTETRQNENKETEEKND